MAEEQPERSGAGLRRAFRLTAGVVGVAVLALVAVAGAEREVRGTRPTA